MVEKCIGLWLIWSLVYFHYFEASLNDAIEVQFFRASFLHLIKDTDLDQPQCMTYLYNTPSPKYM